MLHDGGVGARTPATTAGLVRRGGLVALALAVVLLAVVGLSACSAAAKHHCPRHRDSGR
jgi:hypothetical protein